MTSPTESLADKIELARQGDAVVLGELLDEFRPYLRILAERAMDGRLAGRIDASDVVQQTFLSAVRKFPEFEGSTTETLVAWLVQIHERNLIDNARRHIAAERRSVTREESVADERLDPVELTSPSQRLMRGESAVKLARALSRLPDDQAEAVRLRHLDGWTLNEIAERMAKTDTAVASLLYRGMKNLRALLLDF
jgi:RNA polymerase sigma-70 factor, ECF subfamily